MDFRARVLGLSLRSGAPCAAQQTAMAWAGLAAALSVIVEPAV